MMKYCLLWLKLFADLLGADLAKYEETVFDFLWEASARLGSRSRLVNSAIEVTEWGHPLRKIRLRRY